MVSVTKEKTFKKSPLWLFLFLAFPYAGLSQLPTWTPSLLGTRPGSSGQSAATGVGLLQLEGTSLTYALFYFGSEAPTAAHIHQGRGGEEGPVFVNLNPTFASLGSAFVAYGSVSLEANQANALRNDPAGFYVNVHTPTLPAGAARGQLAGEAAGVEHWLASLVGEEERPNAGDPDGRGLALLIPSGTTLFYFLRVRDIAPPTAAHIHRGRSGQAGEVALTFPSSFADGVALGTATLPSSLAEEIRRSPESFYVNVHTADYPGGALRGQLSTGETVLNLPVVAEVPGLPPSLFRTAGTITNLSNQEAEVWAEWYPASREARTAPAKVTRLAIPSRGTASFDNLLQQLFGVSGRGAVRLVSPAPIAAGVNIFNDQRSSGKGTFGQFAQGLPLDQALVQGVLTYNTHRPKTEGSGWRTNFGWFNPSPQPVTLEVRVLRPDGTAAASKTLTLQPWSNDLLACGDSNGLVPASACSSTNFTVAFSASAPVFLYSSVVDNLTDDGLYQPAQAAPLDFVLPPAPPNHPPSVTITNPAGTITVQTGQMVSFVAAASDPDGDSLTITWDFGDGVRDTSNSLSVAHAYATAGQYTVTVTASDGRGGQAQDSRQVTVQSASAVTLSQLQQDIFTPLCSGCHPPTQGLDLRPGHTYASTVNVPASQMPSLMRVKPGDPDNSYLYRKLRGQGISGSRMPQGGPFLSQSEMDKVRDWILAGAPNN
jgi:hypothetical protein